MEEEEGKASEAPKGATPVRRGEDTSPRPSKFVQLEHRARQQEKRERIKEVEANQTSPELSEKKIAACTNSN